MIPLYRGELHKVSGVPRQWAIPKTQIPLSVFRTALQKRNAALKEFLQQQSSAAAAAGEKTPSNNAQGTPPVANGGTVNTSGLASADGSGEHGKRVGGSENDGDSTPDSRAENGVGSSGGEPSYSTDQSKRIEEETERRRERKRRRGEDSREENLRYIDRKDDSARRDGGESELPSRGKFKISHDGSDPMAIDVVDQAVAMDCDVKESDKVVIDSDGIMDDPVRVRVSDVGASSEMESKQGYTELGTKAVAEGKQKDAGNVRRNGELSHSLAVSNAVSSFEDPNMAAQIQQQFPPAADGNVTGPGSAELRVIGDKIRKKEELEAKLERLRAEKHRFVLRLKQVLHEEEMKKRGSLGTGSPATAQGAVAGANEATGVSTHGEKHGIGASQKSADLEDGELEYARTPSPPSRAIPNMHGSVSSHGTLGPPPLAPVIGRQTSLSQHLSQSASGRGAYYVPGLGVPPSPAAPGMSGGAQSPGAGFMGNLPPPLGSHPYSNMAYQHAAAIPAQKVSSVSHGHGQFSPSPSSVGPVGAGTGVSGGPPGFSGYPMSSSVHSHHSHLSQPASSSLPHIVGQQGVSSSSLLTTPRGPPGYHDIRMGGSTWIQR
ncbi:unnamed protein product [Calypogeia fissa]